MSSYAFHQQALKAAKQNHVRAGEKLFIFLIIFALVWALYYGLVIKFTLGNNALFTLKTYVPEMMLLLALVVGAFSGILRGIPKTGLVLLCLLGIVFCLGVAFDSTSNAAVVIRDVYIPVFFLLLMCSARLSRPAAHSFMNVLTFTMGLYLVVAVVMYLIEAANGYDWTARFYTGYTFWGQDPVSRIEINSNGSAMRLPGPTGSSVKCSLYAVAGLVLFLANDKTKTWKRFVFAALAIVCILLYNNRSSLFGAVVVVLYFIAVNLTKSKWSRFLTGFMSVGIVVIGFLALTSSTGALNTASVFQRFSFWGGMFTDQGVANLFFPTNSFSASSGGEGIAGIGLSTDWDNAYLYMAFAFGVPVLILLLACLIGYWQRLKRLRKALPQHKAEIDYCRYLLLATAIIALATNVFQGRSWFFIFVVVFGTVYACINGVAYEADGRSSGSLDVAQDRTVSR